MWANQFQRNVTIYGYEPSRAEKEKYNRVRAWAEQMNGGMMNPELQWAYNFLEKTRKGYEPKQGEMRQYEQVIERNLNARNGTGSSEGI